MFNWFKKEEIKEKPEEDWIYPKKEWDSVYSKVIDVNNKMRVETYMMYWGCNDVRIWWNKVTENKYYNELSHLLLLTCGTVTREIVTTIYSWREEDGCLYSAESTSKDYDFDELKNGDLVITFYRRWSRARWPPKCQKQGWASRPEFRVLALGLAADTRLLGKTARL